MHKLTLGILVLAILGISGYLYFGREKLSPTPEVVTDGWLTGSGDSLSFKYPADFGTKYLQAFDWPPQVKVLNESYSCTQAGQETARAGRTEERAIGGQKFCVTTLNEGAAGSTYAQYAYITSVNGKTVDLTFTVRYPQCGNYPEAQKNECEAERNSFNLDELVGKIVRTIQFAV